MTTPFHVLIATARRSTLLQQVLDCLVACPKPAGYAGTILVENGRRTGVDELADQYHAALNVRCLFEPIGNKNRALNRGMREIDSGLVVLYDDDVRIAPQSLGAYAAAAADWPDAPFFAGWCGCDYREPPAPHLVPLLPSSAKGWRLDQTGDPIVEAVAMGFNWAVRVPAITALGGFAEDRGPGTAVIVGDESDMQRRMIESIGPGRYVHDARVWHHVPPERCDEQWLLNRAYHTGVARAMALRRGERGAGVPWPVRRRAWSAAVKQGACQLAPSRARRFKSRYYRQLTRGIVAGYRLPMPETGAMAGPVGETPVFNR